MRGRIDHFALDARRHRLFVAELGNGSVGVIDLDKRAMAKRLMRLSEPQGLVYDDASETLYVASAGDGTLRAFHGADLSPAEVVRLGEDADNIRIDVPTQELYVGYGDGALAVFDLRDRRRLPDIPLKAHPEGFQLASDDQRAFVNVPGAGEVAIVDRRVNRQIASWPTGKLAANFPMTFDAEAQQVVIAFRRPPALVALDAKDGGVRASIATCGDADDVFIDAPRHRVHVICGEGFIDSFEWSASNLRRIGRTPTAHGARTGLWVAERRQLFVAVPAGGATRASIWTFSAGD